MKVEYINPFVLGASTVLEMVLGSSPEKGTIAMLPASFTSEQVNVVCGVTGQIHGSLIYGMSLQSADQIASAMLGQPIKIFDQLAASAIAELGNMISGNAMIHLSEVGYICEITPPTLIQGNNVRISTLSVPAIVIPLTTAQGPLSVTVGLQGKK